jgi:hypothetical protein
MNDETHVQTLRPDGEPGENILKSTYEQVSAAVQTALNGRELTSDELVDECRVMLGDDFEGSVEWYVETVRLDLQARKVIEPVPDSQPSRFQLVEEGSASNDNPGEGTNGA